MFKAVLDLDLFRQDCDGDSQIIRWTLLTSPPNSLCAAREPIGIKVINKLLGELVA